ncbi:MAG: MTH1187 family thiamine-binding protein [Bacteroidales bacterium]|jgi:uncharacterized protein (TIGR00106 family)
MSVLLEFAIFPTDKGDSVSEYVSQVIKMIDESGVSYKLTPMGTIIETETLSDALQVVEDAYAILEPHSERVYSSMTLDIRKGKEHRLEGKIASIEQKIGAVKT